MSNALSEIARTLYADLPDAIVVVRQDGTIAHANRHAETLLGYSREQLQALSVDDIVPAAMRGTHGDHRRSFHDHPTARPMGTDLDVVAERADGSIIPLDISLSPADSDQGPVVIAVMRDLRETRALARQLALSRQRLELLIQSVPDCAIFTVGATGHILDWNEGAEQATGYGATEAVGRHVDMLLSADGRLSTGIAAVCATAATDGFAQGSGWCARRDGADFRAELSALRVVASADGHDELAVTVRDVTMAEQSLIRAAAGTELDQVMEAGSARVDALYEVVARHCFAMFSPGYAAVLGPDPRDDFVVLAHHHLANSNQVSQADDLRDWAESGEVVDWTTAGISEVGSWWLIRAPIIVSDQLSAALTVVHAARFSESDLAALSELAAVVEATIGRHRAREDRERVSLLEDQERIARDLHDTVIQRIFAAGLRLQSLSRRVDDAAARADLGDVIDDLDGTISALRMAISGLRSTPEERHLRSKILELVASVASTLGFMPAVHFDEGIDRPVSADLAHDAIVSLREMLSNVARHARASAVQIDVVMDGTLAITVEDDGVGLPPHSAGKGDSSGNGLINLEQRARAHGGSFLITARQAGGTEARWSARLPS